jgi:Family of unknown function (DUF6152)
MNRALILSTALLVLTMLAGPATLAHHSAVMYDNANMKTLEGTVKQFNWTNPHTTLVFIVVTASGEQVPWTVEMSSPGVLTRAGWTKRSFNPGDRVSIELAPLKNGSNGGLFRKAILADGKILSWDFKPGEQPGLK